MSARPAAAIVLLLVTLPALAAGFFLSVSYGAADVSLRTVWAAVFTYDPAIVDHQIIHDVRLPRVVIALMVGAGLAVAGAIMQGMTRNPLADPGLLGLTAGANFLLVLTLIYGGGLPYQTIMLIAFAGAALGAGLVYGIGSLARGGLTPVRLALAGVAVSALLGALADGLVIYYGIAQELLFWYAGGIAGTRWSDVTALLPWTTVGLAGGIMLAPSITVLSLGDEIAIGLGQQTGRVKAAGSLATLLLAGSAVVIAGPVAFIGLVIPHVTRFMVGLDYRWLIPCAAVVGGLFLILADLGARMVNPPYEMPVGVITALVGVPFFLVLARNDRRGM
ncbi:MAG: iron ABC transporter permease [Thermomicrobiales bacterium]|nr:iron ABC transporter permease [Thermomicrobiales bacterium]